MIFGWLLFCAAVGYWANKRGRSPLLWALLACVISPLLAGIILVLMKNKNQKDKIIKTQMDIQQIKKRVALPERTHNKKIKHAEKHVEDLGKKIETEKHLDSVADIKSLDRSTDKQCPVCGKIIKLAAIKCRYCGAELEEVKMEECPFCKELIRSDAVKCKYCRSDIPKTPVQNDPVDTQKAILTEKERVVTDNKKGHKEEITAVLEDTKICDGEALFGSDNSSKAKNEEGN